MGEANKLLDEGKITLDEWKAVYADCKKFQGMVDNLETPKHPDARAWYEAKQEALEELARENGLRLQIDL